MTVASLICVRIHNQVCETLADRYLAWNSDYIYEIHDDAGRSLMGSHQENWFYRQLSESSNRGATWRVIGNQIVFSRINITSWFGTFENPYNGDQWDVSFPPFFNIKRRTDNFQRDIRRTGTEL